MTEAGNAAYEAAIRAARLNRAGGIGAGAISDDVEAGATAAVPPAPGIRHRLEIVAGAHHGAVLTLEPGAYRIGSSPDADIVLSDDGVAPDHAAVHVDADGVRLDAIGADITIGDEPLPRGRGCRLWLPAHFSIGAARIEVVDLTKRSGAERGGVTLRSPALLAAAAACIGVVIAVTAITAREFGFQRGINSGTTGTGTTATGTTARDLQVVIPKTDKTDGTGDPRPVPPPPGTVEEALAALRSRLAAADIKSIEVTAEAGRLVARGTLSEQEAVNWQPIQQWFDKTYGRTIVLSARIMPGMAPDLPSLQIQSVWYGPHPYVMLADGAHYYENSRLDSGWTITEILPDHLVLAKDGNKVTLTYH